MSGTSQFKKFIDLRNPLEIKRLNDEFAHIYRMMYGGIGVKNISSGTIDTTKIRNPELADDVVPGNRVIFDSSTNKWIKYQKGIGVVDKELDIVVIGECELSNLALGYNAYTDENGDLTQDKITDYKIGYAKSSTILLVMPGGEWGIPKAYTVDAVMFKAKPGASGKVLLEIELDPDNDEGMIRYKTTGPWIEGDDETTGTLVTTITDDTNYHGLHKYYQISDLIDDTKYYFKLFTKKGTVFNTLIGHNETSCRAGGHIHRWTMDNVMGSAVIDDIGGSNGNAYNVTYVASQMGDAASFNGSNSRILLPNSVGTFPASDFTLVCRFKSGSIFSSNVGRIFSNRNGYHFEVGYNDNRFLVMFSGITIMTVSLSIDTEYKVKLVRSLTNGLRLFINDVLVATDPYVDVPSSNLYENHIGHGRIAYPNPWLGTIDEVDIYDRALDDDENV